jgi:putative transposase
MARTARAAVGGVCYHVLNSGNDRKTIFQRPSDFDHFLRIAALARARDFIEVLAYSLMPNHFHFVVRPGASRTLSRWVHWMLSTHAVAHRRCYETAGHLWQSRFKAFPIEDDHHLLTVMRYVERNALRASLVARAEDWRWGSLNERLGFRPRGLLDDSPCTLPRDWCALVNANESDSELRDLRACIGTGRPFASDQWIRRTEATRGARFESRPRGRPKKSEHAR